MTGFGEAHRRQDHIQASIEIRSVNNRYFKLALRWPDPLAPFETDLERLIRETSSRGTISVLVRVEDLRGASPVSINHPLLEQYWHSLSETAARLGASNPTFADLLALPGAVSKDAWSSDDAEVMWKVVRDTAVEALARLQQFRTREGQAMADDLTRNVQVIRHQLDEIAVHAPQVVVEYRDRLHERVKELLKQHEVTVTSSDLVREVSLFADRCDINEEITRLRSHLDQFDRFLHEPTSQGRKIEFLLQEMFREINTIGSKANNVSIAHGVVDMKAALERMREVIQNVE